MSRSNTISVKQSKQTLAMIRPLDPGWSSRIFQDPDTAVNRSEPFCISSLLYCPRQRPRPRSLNCVKLLGQGLMARDFDLQVAEIQIRIAVLNRYTALGIPVTEPVG